ncbi:MAG: cytidine deaminase [Rhodothermales bacterium]
MKHTPADASARLRALARAWVHRAYSPFSHRPDAAILLLGDGAWVPGVRVESASYSLEIPSVQNAISTAVALGRRDIVALAMSRPITPEDAAYLGTLPEIALAQVDEALFAATGPLPQVAPEPLSPYLDADTPATSEEGLGIARRLAARAYVPESDFPVACVIETGTGLLVPGVNVEHPTWSRILCAERNALGTLVTYGIQDPETMYLTCTREPGCTPCGACRQLLAELTPEATLWMDSSIPGGRAAHPYELLPEFFTGATLFRTPNPRDTA